MFTSMPDGYATTIFVRNADEPLHPAPVREAWRTEATRKGFDALCRVRDANHIALRCQTCGGLHISASFTLTKHNPVCPHCVESRWRATADKAGLTFLRRVKRSLTHRASMRHYALYARPCGHVVQRQFATVERAARGEIEIGCERCRRQREADEARYRGWIRLGRDPQDRNNYRLYRHIACGHTQRIAVANMLTGRFHCGQCGEGWSAAPSYLYAMRFTLQDGTRVVKMGFSRDPQSRLIYQLKTPADIPRDLLATVDFPTGRAALIAEKRLHKTLKARLPDAALPRAAFKGQINVKSEIYKIEAEPLILEMLAAITAARRRIPKP